MFPHPNYKLSFVQDHSAAFKSKTTWEVLRALMVFQVCGINVVVDNNEKVRVGTIDKDAKLVIFLI
jgi:hypothetical protein